MGNQANCVPQFSPEQYSSQFKQMSKTSSGVLLMHRKSNQQFFLKEFSFTSKKAFISKLEHFKKMHASENILNLNKVWAKEKSSLCSDSFQIFAVYEYPEICLRDQIDSRSIQGQPFDQHDIWSIGQSCVNAITEQSAEININTSNIFIIEDGVLKLISQDMCDMIFRKVVDKRQCIYYAPEKITRFNNGDEENDIKKQALFSSAMVMLQAALLKNISDCYDYDSYKFKPQKLTEYLVIAQQRYSAQLVNLLNKMLLIDPNQRISLEELSLKLNQFWDNFQGTELASQQNIKPNNRYQHRRRNRSSLSQRQNNITELQQSETKKLLNCGSKQTQNPDNFKNKRYQKNGSLIISHQNSFIDNHRQIYFTQQKPKISSNKQKQQGKKQNNHSLNAYKNQYHYLFTDQKFLNSICGSLTKNETRKNSHSVFENQNQTKIQKPKSQKAISDINQIFINEQGSSSCQRKLYHCPTLPKQISFCNKSQKSTIPVTCRIQKQKQSISIQNSIQKQKKCIVQMKTFRNSNQKITKQKQDKLSDYEQSELRNNFGVQYNLKFRQEIEKYEFKMPSEAQIINWIDQMIESWIKYEGHFQNDLKHGKGRLYLHENCQFEGQFYRGNIQGQGSFKKQGKLHIEGVWINNKLSLILN